MRCERHNGGLGASQRDAWEPPSWWRRIYCGACRREYAADRFIERAAAQLRMESPPEGSLARTLAAIGCSSPEATAAGMRDSRTALARALALVGVGIFATTLAQPEQIGRGLFGTAPGQAASVQGVAGFWALLGLFWYLKPLAALLLESVPGLVYRRSLCLMAGVAGAAVLWLVSAFRVPSGQPLPEAVGIGVNAMLALASTILGGYLVEQAQRIGASGRLGALHQAAVHLAGMTAPLIGLAIGRAFAPAIAASLLLLFGILVAFLMPAESVTRRRPAGITAQLKTLSRARGLWQVAVMLLLVIGPSSFDALLTKQQVLHGLSHAQRLQLTWISEAATLVSVLSYIALCRRMRLQSLLPAGIIANAGGTVLYLAYAGPLRFPAAAAIEVVNGLAAALIIVTLFDLAVRSVPAQCAYIGYAVLTSVSNLARTLSELLTSSLAFGFPAVVALSAFCSLLALLLVVRLPRALVTRREGEPAHGPDGRRLQVHLT